jgi:hypothetical protein
MHIGTGESKSRGRWGCFALGAMLVSSLALADDGRATRLELGAAFYGRGVQDTLQSGQLFGTEIDGGLEHRLFENGIGRLQVATLLEAGSYQVFYTDENRPRQAAELREASLAWTPWRGAELRIGAVPQNLLDWAVFSPYLAFPGVIEQVHYPLGQFFLSFVAEQAIPTTGTFADEPPARTNDLPAFFRERIGFGWAPSDDFSLEARVAHYLFENLPETAAYPSRFDGNSVSGEGLSHSEFTYPFRGYELELVSRARLLRGLTASFEGSWLRNGEAPAGRSDGFTLGVRLETAITRGWIIRPFGQLYRLESDVIPALYTDRDSGHTNRRGFILGAELDLDGNGTVGVRYDSATTLLPSPYQADWRSVFFYYRSTYEIL